MFIALSSMLPCYTQRLKVWISLKKPETTLPSCSNIWEKCITIVLSFPNQWPRRVMSSNKTEQKLSENCSINQKEQPVSSLPNQCWARYSNIFNLLLFSYNVTFKINIITFCQQLLLLFFQTPHKVVIAYHPHKIILNCY